MTAAPNHPGNRISQVSSRHWAESTLG